MIDVFKFNASLVNPNLKPILYPLLLGSLVGFIAVYAGVAFASLIIIYLISSYLAYRKTWMAVGVLFLLAPYEFYGKFSTITITSNEVIILALLSGFIFKFLEGNRFNYRILVLFLPFIFVQFLSLAGVLNFGAGIKQILRWCEFFLVFLLAYHSFRNFEEFKKASSLLVFGSIPIALYGVYQSLIGFGGFMSEIIPMTAEEMKLNVLFGTFIRAHSILIQANHLGAYLVIIIPLSLLVRNFCQSKSFPSKIIENSLLIKHIGKFITMLLLVALFLTMSRSAWIALFISFGLVWLATYFYNPDVSEKKIRGSSKSVRKLFAAFLLIVFFAVVITFLVPQIKVRIATFGDLSEDLASQKRITFYKVGLDIIRDFPLLGVGSGNYTSISERYAPEGMDPIGSKIHLHNLYLQIAVESGLLGLTSFIFFIVSVYLFIVNSYFKSDCCQKKLIMIVIIASFAFLIQNMADIFFVKGIHFLWSGLTGGLMGVLAKESTYDSKSLK